jgi:DNA repair exonuclease SbcCD nuclease subunit
VIRGHGAAEAESAMKFVHAADLHLDSPLLALSRQDARQVERMRRASREAFERLVDLCIDQAAALLVIAGDLYDHDCPNMQIAVFLRKELRRLEQSGTRVVIIKGNHDADNKITSALALPANTRVLGEQKPQTIAFDDLPVRIALHGGAARLLQHRPVAHLARRRRGPRSLCAVQLGRPDDPRV